MPSEIMEKRGASASSRFLDDISYVSEVIINVTASSWFAQIYHVTLKKLIIILTVLYNVFFNDYQFQEHFTA